MRFSFFLPTALINFLKINHFLLQMVFNNKLSKIYRCLNHFLLKVKPLLYGTDAIKSLVFTNIFSNKRLNRLLCIGSQLGYLLILFEKKEGLRSSSSIACNPTQSIAPPINWP